MFRRYAHDWLVDQVKDDGCGQSITNDKLNMAQHLDLRCVLRPTF